MSVLTPILAEENIDDWLADIKTASRKDGFDTVANCADSADTLSVGLLGLYAGIDLEGTSEFGTIREYFIDPEQDLSELFGAEVEAVTDPTAYPELQ